MAGIYTSSHTGEAIDVAVSARTEVIDRVDFNALVAQDVDVNKIYILSDTNEMYRSSGVDDKWILLSTGVPTTTLPTEPSIPGVNLVFLQTTPSSFQPGWLYFVYDEEGHTVDHIYYGLDENITLTIK